MIGLVLDAMVGMLRVSLQVGDHWNVYVEPLLLADKHKLESFLNLCSKETSSREFAQHTLDNGLSKS